MSETTDRLSDQVREYVGESVWVEVKDGRISEYNAVARKVEQLLNNAEPDRHIDYLTAGALIRNSIRATLERAGAQYVEEKHLLSSTFWDIEVPGRNAGEFARYLDTLNALD